MSYRTWLGEGELPFADFCLCNYESIRQLCAAASWRLPARAYSPDKDHMAEFLQIMEDEYCMLPKDFSALYIGTGPGTWEDYEGGTRT